MVVKHYSTSKSVAIAKNLITHDILDEEGKKYLLQLLDTDA